MSSGGALSGSAFDDAMPQRPRWVRPLTIVNFVFVGISALVAIFIAFGWENFTVAMFFFPQVAMTLRTPAVGLIVAFLTLLTCAIVAFTAKRPRDRGKKFYTALTMCGFIINCLCLVAPFLVLLLAQV